ncbi:MAG: YdhR family protein [Roseibium sp.]
MTEDNSSACLASGNAISRRQVIAGTAATSAAMLLSPTLLQAQEIPTMEPKAFVYTEVAISVPFAEAPWKKINDEIKKQPGFLNKTWLQGHSTQSIGGLYSFDSLENAQAFVTGYFPNEARAFGVAHTTRVFDAALVRDASLDMGAVHFGTPVVKSPGAFVYTELQFSKPFNEFDWHGRNEALKQSAGLQNKIWLSGVNTNTLGGFDAFDTLDQALEFAIGEFPKTAARLGSAFYTRVFDASITEAASRDMNSPFYVG